VRGVGREKPICAPWRTSIRFYATSATPEFAAKVRELAASRGKNVSAIVLAALTDYVANA
jgi:hypothetical protein